MKQWVVPIISFVVGVLVSLGVWGGISLYHSGSSVVIPERNFSKAVQFTSAFLECPGFNGADHNLNDARKQIVTYLDSLEESDDSLDVSVYVRDLNNGPWIGINEREVYLSASLMKVPVLMMLLKRAEINPTLLLQEIVYDPEKLDPAREPNVDAVLSDYRLVPGQTYTIQRLIENMIRHSDNEAFYILVNMIPDSEYGRFESEVGVDWNEEDYPYRVSAKNYSSFFRVLYNASYLNRDMSEYALSLLSQSSFDFGLRNGVPDGVIVANKYGNQEEYEPTEDMLKSRSNLILGRRYRFLHDCGIVYSNGQPYAICVMTRSAEKSNATLSKIISEVSRIVYSHRS